MMELSRAVPKPNIVLIGTSGAGKSTLINAVLGTERAATGTGRAGTRKMNIYDEPEAPFRLIDTRGLEYGLLEQIRAKGEITRWAKRHLRTETSEHAIDMIWFCIDATSRRIFTRNLDAVKAVSRVYKDIPVVIVFTKAYSKQEADENLRALNAILDEYGRERINLKDILPVVAKAYPLTDEIVVPPMGIDTLIARTTELLPDYLQHRQAAVRLYEGRVQGMEAYGLVSASALAAVTVGAVPVPCADSAILVPLQTLMIQGLCGIYHVDTRAGNLVDTIVKCGAVTVAARATLSALKLVIPAGIVLNAAVAGVFTATLGELTIQLMEQIKAGTLDADNFDTISSVLEMGLSATLGKYLEAFSSGKKTKWEISDVAALIKDIFSKKQQ